MKKLSLMLVLLLIMSLCFVGCGSQEGNETVTQPDSSSESGSADNSNADGQNGDATATTAQELTFVLHNEPDGIDPNITSNSFAMPFLASCFEGLMTYNEDMELVDGVAKSHSISEDGLTYTFTLRDNLKWSDGTPMTAKDFEYSIKRVLKPETAAQYLTMVTDYIVNAQEVYDGKVDISELGVQVPDDKTLIIQLKDPAPYFLDILSMPVYSPIQQATVEANGDKWTLKPETYIGNGPFMMSEMNLGESMVVVKNPNYYDADKVNLEKITYRYIKDQATALSAFESGEIDGFREVPSADLLRLKSESDDLYTLPTYATTYYLINNKKAPYDNPKVREAINLAIDRKALIDNVLQGSGKPAFALVSPGYSVDGKGYADERSNFGLSPNADVEKARKLLAEAGYPNGEGFPTLELSYYTHPQVKQIVEAMAQMLQENLNIEVKISTEEWKVYYDGIQQGNYEVAAMGWGGDYLNPMTFLPLLVSDDPLNNSGYANPEYDKAVFDAKKETDPAKAMAMMLDAENIAMVDYPILPLYHRATNLMMKPYVEGWYLTPTNNLYFKYAKIVK